MTTTTKEPTMENQKPDETPKLEWAKPTVETMFVKDTENDTSLFAQDSGPHHS